MLRCVEFRDCERDELCATQCHMDRTESFVRRATVRMAPRRPINRASNRPQQRSCCFATFGGVQHFLGPTVFCGTAAYAFAGWAVRRDKVKERRDKRISSIALCAVLSRTAGMVIDGSPRSSTALEDRKQGHQVPTIFMNRDLGELIPGV